jgi:hypothetical protein
MAIIHFSKEQILVGPLDEERNELLEVLAELDTSPRTYKYLRSLIQHRLSSIDSERRRLNLPETDVAEYAEIKAYVEHMNRSGGLEPGEVS